MFGNSIPVGRDVFELMLTSERIINDAGRECAMRIDYDENRIIISDRIPQHLRPQTVAIAVNVIWERKISPVPVLSDVS